MLDKRKDLTMHFGADRTKFKFAQYLRENMTISEKLLWDCLRKNQLGMKIRRQHPIGDYIADFYCHKARLVIEIDGNYHNQNNQKEYDYQRDLNLRELGIEVIRFDEDQVMNNIEFVIKKIKERINPNAPPLIP
jgi:imidazole glycerol-phosphate synthase subunit HisF